MRIAYNPKTAAALTTAPVNNDITFDLSGLSIYVKGVRFKGTDTTYSVFKKHGSNNSGGYDGLVPVPSYNNNSKNRYLREDGTWVIPTNTTYTFADGTDGSFTVTPSSGSGQKVTIGKPATAGTADKVSKALTLKIKTGTTEGTDLYTYDGSVAKTLDIKAGANITLTPIAGVLTIAATTYTLSGALNNNTFVTTLTPSSGTATTAIIPAMVGATSSAAGKAGLVPAPVANKHTSFLRGDGTWATPPDTHWTTHLYVGAKDAASNAATTNSNTYIKITDNSTIRNQYIIKGSGITAVASDANGNITINTPASHNLPTSDINKLTGYAIATLASVLATTDTLNVALGKLEYKLNITYDLVTKANDSDGTIENLKEILDVLAGIKDTETIKAIIGKYLPLTGGTMTGALKRYYDTASNDPMIALTSSNLDVWLWRINSGTAAALNTQKAYGFGLKYIGTGSGDANNLVLYADNQEGAQVAAMTVSQSGTFTFANTVNATTFIKAGSNDNYVLLGGGGHKAVSDFATSGHTHNYLPLAGGTMSGDIVMGTSHYIFGANENSGSMLHFDGTKTVVGSVGTSTSAATAIRTKTGHVTCGPSGTEYTILDSNNYNTWVASKSHTHNYLPLTGGTISNNTRNLLRIKNTDSTGSSAIWFGGDFGNFTYGGIVEYSSKGNMVITNFKSYNTNYKNISSFRITSDGKIQCGDVNYEYKVYDILHSGNYNSYSPTLTGTGASGTWPISITGNSTTSNWLNPNDTLTYGASGLNYFNLSGTKGNTKANNTPTADWYHILRMNHANSAGYLADIAIPLNDVKGVWWRQIRNGSFYGWYRILDSNNYTEFTATKTGSGASGTWDISITGNAATATALTSSAGSAILPIYFSGGKPVTCTMSTGNSAGILRSFGRGKYTSANRYFGNGTIVTIDPKGTGCISNNDTIISLGDYQNRNTQLLTAYDRDGVYYRRIGDSLSYGSWRRLAFTDDNVASATKLQTARTIWGKSFDGTGNVNGTMSFINGDIIYANDEAGNSRYVMGLTSVLSFGYGSAGAGIDTHILGNNLYLKYGTSRTTGLTLNSSGNVGIGTTSPNYKLLVNGIICSINTTFFRGSNDGTIDIYTTSNNNNSGTETVVILTGIDNRYGRDYTISSYGGDARHLLSLLPLGGYVNVGYINNMGYKLAVNGGIYSNNTVNSNNFVSRVATGTQPYACTSTTVNTNLNADLLDGYHSTLFYKLTSFSVSDGSKNCDDLSSDSFYTFKYDFNSTTNTLTNRPNGSGIDGGCSLLSINHGAYSNQIFFDYGGGNLWFRGLSYDNGKKWGPWHKLLHTENYTSYVNTTNFPGLNKTGTVTSVTVTGANGLSGSGTVSTSGTITLSNAGVRSTTINGNYLRVNTNGTNADLTIPYATNADTVDNLHASDFVRAMGTLGTGNSYDSDWGLSMVTFDPIVSGTAAESNPNVTILNLGNNYGRRKQLWFNYSNNNIYYRRRVGSSWSGWVRLALASEIPTNTWRGITDSYSGTDSAISLSQKGANSLYNTLVNGYASSAGNADTLDGYHASGLFTNLSNTSDNKISITVGGTNKTLTVGYATKSDSVNLVNSSSATNLLMAADGGYTTVKRLTGTIGSTTKPIWIQNGIPKGCVAAGTFYTPIYLSPDGFKVATSFRLNLYKFADRTESNPMIIGDTQLSESDVLKSSLFAIDGNVTVVLPTPSASLVGTILFFKSINNPIISCPGLGILHKTAVNGLLLNGRSAIFVCMKDNAKYYWVALLGTTS